MRNSPLVLAVLVLGSAALGVAALKSSGYGSRLAAWARGEQAGKSNELTLLPRIHTVPEFDLLEADGSRLTRDRFEGRVWVASFLFTNCASTCPAMALKCQSLQAILPAGVLMVSFSADPERDTPEVLTKWGRFQNRQPAKWLLGTGTWAGISQLAEKGFFLGGQEPLLHSTRFALVDQHCNLRGYYDSRDEAEMARLVRDVNLLLVEGMPPAAAPAPPPLP